jgi:hypothetical protein
MRLFRTALLLIIPAALAFAQQTSVFADPHALATELRRLESTVGQTPLADDWIVDADGRSYSISTAPLRQILGTHPDAKKIAEARQWLENLAHELERASSPSLTRGNARARLTNILSRREFAAARPPTLWERLAQKIFDWIGALIRSILAFAQAHPTTGTILFWVVAAIAVIFLGLLLLRFWTRKGRIVPPPPDSAIPARTWQQWMAAAKEAGERGDLRAAIHFAYWAAVVRLQETDVLPRDLTRTPREYLRLMPDRAASHAPLATLTGALERFWYASRPASPADLRQSFDCLEALGCHLE